MFLPQIHSVFATENGLFNNFENHNILGLYTPLCDLLSTPKSKLPFYCDFCFVYEDLLLTLHQNRNILDKLLALGIAQTGLALRSLTRNFEMMTQQEIGNAIKERRKKLGINQQTLADLASVAVNTVVAIERGEGNPQLATLLTLLDTLGLQIGIDIKQLDYETV